MHLVRVDILVEQGNSFRPNSKSVARLSEFVTIGVNRKMSRLRCVDHVAVEVIIVLLDFEVVLQILATPLLHITSIEPVRLVNVRSSEVSTGVSDALGS